ncbi:MAG TPA: hypothetical protein VMT89_02780 [Candidatus Acidoferrales bacterium]|nr:hypothetical protein [Candidatus Acidoferrales bacterium]
MAEQSRLTVALAVSLLLHGLLLAMLPFLRTLRSEVPQLPPLLDVDIASIPPPAPPPPAAAAKPPNAAPAQAVPAPQLLVPKKQIVSPSDAGEEKPPPENTRLLSDRDNVVPEEKVHRSLIPSAAESKPPPAPEPEKEKEAAKAEAPPAPAARELPRRESQRTRDAAPSTEPMRRSNTQVASLPKLDQLLPQPGDYAVGAGSSSAPAVPTPAANGEPRRLLMGGSREAFSTNRGISDFLPGIREGDITLLNTKAERFAPFVRRVAARVFQHLDIRLRQSVGNTTVRSGREYAVVEAVMSKKGRLINARVVERQSTSTLGADRILLSVTEPDTFFDENPPPGAEANDGNIHFILLIDIMVQSMQEPRTGRVVGGYHGMASVGLDTAPDERNAQD